MSMPASCSGLRCGSDDMAGGQELYLRPFSSWARFAVQIVPSGHSTKQHAQHDALREHMRPQAGSHGITEPCQQVLRLPEDHSCPFCPVSGQGRLDDELTGDCKTDVVGPDLQGMGHISIPSTPSHR